MTSSAERRREEMSEEMSEDMSEPFTSRPKLMETVPPAPSPRTAETDDDICPLHNVQKDTHRPSDRPTTLVDRELSTI